jgi:hypothetical protein
MTPTELQERNSSSSAADELEAIIEEARRRTRRRRRRAAAAVGAALALGIAGFVIFGGGGTSAPSGVGAGPPTGAVAPQQVDLLRNCPDEGWSARVAGIGCFAADKLILNEFLPSFDQTALDDLNVNDLNAVAASPPGSFERGGFSCEYGAPDRQTGWAIDCQRQSQRIQFHATP